MESNKTIDLTFIATKELIEELDKRYDALNIAGIKFTNVNGGYSVTRHWNGHRYVCLGLLANLESLINEAENKSLFDENR